MKVYPLGEMVRRMIRVVSGVQTILNALSKTRGSSVVIIIKFLMSSGSQDKASVNVKSQIISYFRLFLK
jgi:hypothetical protein